LKTNEPVNEAYARLAEVFSKYTDQFVKEDWDEAIEKQLQEENRLFKTGASGRTYS